MKDEKDLEMKYLVIKLYDIKTYMTKDQQMAFWGLFWGMIAVKDLANTELTFTQTDPHSKG